MLSTVLVCALAPVPGGNLDRGSWGPFSFERETRLTWPGLQTFGFNPSFERRRMHRFSLWVTDLQWAPAVETVLFESPDGTDLSSTTARSMVRPPAPVGVARLSLPLQGTTRISVERRWALQPGRNPLRDFAGDLPSVNVSGFIPWR